MSATSINRVQNAILPPRSLMINSVGAQRYARPATLNCIRLPANIFLRCQLSPSVAQDRCVPPIVAILDQPSRLSRTMSLSLMPRPVLSYSRYPPSMHQAQADHSCVTLETKLSSLFFFFKCRLYVGHARSWQVCRPFSASSYSPMRNHQVGTVLLATISLPKWLLHR